MRFLSVAMLILAAAALSGCQNTTRAIGLERTVPDEFAVAAPAPLVIPPDFNLRPPAPGSERERETSAAEQGRAVLVGRAKLQEYQRRGFSQGETAILGLAGADNVPPGIRSTLDKEVSSFAPESRELSERLQAWREGASGAPSDPAAEMQRLSQSARTDDDAQHPSIGKGGRFF